MRRITVNLAPADLRKAGPAYDLPIAVALLRSSGQVPELSDSAIFLGELSLDGSVRHTDGILSMVAVAREMAFDTAFVPSSAAKEAALVEGIEIIPVESLGQLVQHLRGEAPIPSATSNGVLPAGDTDSQDEKAVSSLRVDLADIRGQEHAKRALEIAAVGSHNLLMSGPPGSGKTLLARALPSIMPRLTPQEALDVTKIYSVSGLLPHSSPLMTERPFRAPHYTISNAGLVGGGRVPKPGEITLSHRGILFLDELPEFNRAVLEVLRQPLEDKVVTISRAQGRMTFPANFMFVAAMNPCNCGFFGDASQRCGCTPSAVARYKNRISGPLLDRIDLFVEVPRVEYEKLVQPSDAERSHQVRNRVEAARLIQQARFQGTDMVSNADMGPAQVWDYCKTDDAASNLLQAAVNQMKLSARGFHRILKVARTIADLSQVETIGVAQLAEALQYRPKGVE